MADIPLRKHADDAEVVGGTAKASSNCRPCLIGFAIGLAVGIALLLGVYFGVPRYTSSTQDKLGPADSNQTSQHSWFGTYSTAAVASDAGTCSEIGAKKLRLGGSAVDAAIATMVCGGLYNPQSTGVGGGSFISIYNASTGESVFINCRETAPIKSSENMYGGNGYMSVVGSLAVAVPGQIAGYWEAHQRYGKLPWASLFEESIELASKGIRVSTALERDIKKEQKYIRNATFNLKSVFMNPDGSLKKEGDIVVRKAFAQTLRAIADEGVQGFYNGTLAKNIIADLQDAVEESIITIQDLQNYKVEIKPLLNVTDGDLTTLTPGTPSSGAVLALILNILKGYKFTPDDLNTKEASILTYHRIIEAFKHAFAHRSQLGDENFRENVTELVQRMMSPEYGEQLRNNISDDVTYNSSQYGGDFAIDGGTSHVSVVGSDGSAVAATSSINLRFGSKVRGIRTGIIFNNEMDDFSSSNVTNYFGLPPSQANFIAPGKRPMSSMVPTMVFRRGSRKPVLVIGASGGTRIITATALVIMQSTWFGKNIQDATEAKRIHHQLYPEEVQYERGFDMDILEGLKKKGHKVRAYTPPGSVVQSIKSPGDSGNMTAVSDMRKGGYPDGY